jgi:hypothetical protein
MQRPIRSRSNTSDDHNSAVNGSYDGYSRRSTNETGVVRPVAQNAAALAPDTENAIGTARSAYFISFPFLVTLGRRFMTRFAGDSRGQPGRGVSEFAQPGLARQHSSIDANSRVRSAAEAIVQTGADNA